MESIFHERQEGSLCAQHCLNALLQGSYFTAVELGDLAQQMDDEERKRMAENGEESEEYRRFLAQPSGNMDDSGYFSVQVISSALCVWGLELKAYNSADHQARQSTESPSQMDSQAFICNYKEHWFTIRKLGNQWFNLNSLLAEPQLISNTYLDLFLTQLKKEGYSIFIVSGELPECEADRILKIHPLIPVKKLSISSESKPQTSKSQEEKDLETALKLSLGENPDIINVDDDDLKKAIDLSLQDDVDMSDDEESEEKQLRKAMAMSLECKTPSAPSTPNLNPEEVRNKRMAFLEKISKP